MYTANTTDRADHCNAILNALSKAITPEQYVHDRPMRAALSGTATHPTAYTRSDRSRS